MTDAIGMVTHVILRDGLMLHVLGNRQEVREKVIHGAINGFVALELVGDDGKLSKVDVQKDAVFMITREHEWKTPSSMPLPVGSDVDPDKMAEGTTEVVL